MTLPEVRVRFAPSPTGYLHVGGARTALFNWLYARKHSGRFLLRIEDTDKVRSTEASTRAIFDGLAWLGLWSADDAAEEVVHQSLNLPRHQADARRLLEGGLAYRCFCTPSELEERRRQSAASKDAFKYDRRCDRLDADEVRRRVAGDTPSVIRFRVPEGTTAWDDMVHETISFPNKDIDDFVILRSDGTPIYNLAVVSDDISMRITHVMRGDDHVSNTPKQIMLYQALGATLPRFAHFPMIHGPDGKKLSKRHGAVAVSDYSAKGILPDAMKNFLALLGWSPGGNREMMTPDELLEHFSDEGFLKKAAVFDEEKLKWMNGQYLAKLDDAALLGRAGEYLREHRASVPLLYDQWNAWEEPARAAAVALVRAGSRTLDELIAQALRLRPSATVEPRFDERAAKVLNRDTSIVRAHLLEAATLFESLSAEEFAIKERLEHASRALATRLGASTTQLFQPIRVAVTRSTVSPPLFDVLVLYSQPVVVSRLRETAALLPVPVATPAS